MQQPLGTFQQRGIAVLDYDTSLFAFAKQFRQRQAAVGFFCSAVCAVQQFRMSTEDGGNGTLQKGKVGTAKHGCIRL